MESITLIMQHKFIQGNRQRITLSFPSISTRPQAISTTSNLSIGVEYKMLIKYLSPILPHQALKILIYFRKAKLYKQ